MFRKGSFFMAGVLIPCQIALVLNLIAFLVPGERI